VRRRRRRGEGTVYKSGDRWIARYPLGTVNGKRSSKRVKCRTEREALAELERMRRLYGSGGNPATGTLGAYLDEWLAGWQDVRASTRTSYEGHIRLHINPLLGGIPLSKVQPSDVRRLVAELQAKGLKPASIVRIVTTLRIALNAAVGERIVTDNAAKHVKLPRVEREPVIPITPDYADAIVDATADTWIGPIVRLLLGSGLRLGEAVGLDQGDLLLDEGFVRVRRSKTMVRAVPVTDDAVDALRQALAAAPRRGSAEPVFYSPRKPRERLRGQSVTHALPRILEAAGLRPISPHQLRHGAATLMLYAGHQMRVISEQLGHRNKSITEQFYAHVIPAAQRAAVASLERRRAR
jgi:integrase